MLCKNVNYLVLCMYLFMILFINSLIPFKVRHNGTVISPFIHVYNIGF